MENCNIHRKSWETTRLNKIQIDEMEEVSFFTYPILERPELVHGFSTRQGGVSRGIFQSMNLSFTRGDDPQAVRINYQRFSKALGIPENRYVFSSQTHTTNVRRATSLDLQNPGDAVRFPDTDGMVTNEKGVALITFYADCVPLYFYDPVKQAIGLSHAGWKGTVNRMAAKTIQLMSQEFQTDPADLICAIGPSICGECYQIGEDVADIFRTAFGPSFSEICVKQKDQKGKYLLDLWKANRQILTEAGVKEEHIACTDVCTCCNSDLLFSHRASNGHRGNLAAVLMLK